jgi:hypothetical protein
LSGGLGERNTPDTEVERRGGEQARRKRAGSLKPLQDPTIRAKLFKPASALLLCGGNICDEPALIAVSLLTPLDGGRPTMRGHGGRKDDKKRPALVWTTGAVHRPDRVQQPFSRLRLTAPRLNLHLGSHLRPCLVAPTIDGASLEPPPATPCSARILRVFCCTKAGLTA